MDDAISREQAIKATWQDTGYTDPFNVMTAVRDRIKQLPTIQPKSGKWIPVKQELPQDDTIVLVCGKNGGIYTAIYNNSKAWVKGWWKMNSKNHHCNPIAWMPLPKVFKENEHEGN